MKGLQVVAIVTSFGALGFSAVSESRDLFSFTVSKEGLGEAIKTFEGCEGPFGNAVRTWCDAQGEAVTSCSKADVHMDDQATFTMIVPVEVDENGETRVHKVLVTVHISLIDGKATLEVRAGGRVADNDKERAEAAFRQANRTVDLPELARITNDAMLGCGGPSIPPDSGGPIRLEH